jgi:hypothetical protein
MPDIQVHREPQIHTRIIKRLGRTATPLYWVVCSECGNAGPYHERPVAEHHAAEHAEGHRHQPVTRVDPIWC